MKTQTRTCYTLSMVTETVGSADVTEWFLLHLGDFSDAFIQSDLQPFIHTFTPPDGRVGDSQLVSTSG